MMSRRTRIRLCIAIATGLSATALDIKITRAQQSPNDQTVFLNANDASGVSSFFGGPTYQWSASTLTYSTTPLTNAAPLAAKSAPTAGYAYVVTGSANGAGGTLRTPLNGGTPYTFGGDSLTVIPYNGQANLYNTSTTIVNAQDTTAGLFIYGNTSGQSITVNNLVLANGGAVLNSGQKGTTLNGTIDLLPTGTTLDGITTNVSGGIIDARSSNTIGLNINSTLIGSGLLHVLSTGGTATTTVSLNGSNGSFSGGVLLDNTVGSGTTSGSSTFPILEINSPTALGTGTFTIGSNNISGGSTVGAGPTIDNTTGSAETLTTNSAHQWNGNFQFKGTNSLNVGSGTVTLGAPVSLIVTNSTLTVNAITGPYGLTLAGLAPFGGALEVPQLSSITTSGLTVASGATLAFPAATTSPDQFVSYANNNAFSTAGALLGIDTTGVTGGTYNLSSNLPGNAYGINKIGSGTLLLSGSNTYTGLTVISSGTLMLGSSTALGGTGDVNLGSNFGGPNGTLDLNGYSITIPQPTGGAYGGLITNSNATPSTLTLAASTAFLSNSTYFGNISGGNLSIAIAFPAIVSDTVSYPFEVLNGHNTYGGTTTLLSGVYSAGSANSLPPTSQQVLFNGGTLYLSSGGFDPSATFNQSAGQQYNITLSGTNTFATGLNSSGGALTVGSTNAYLDGPTATLVLAAANQYTGPTVVNSSVLQLANPAAVVGTSGITVNTYQGFAVGSPIVSGTLQINDSSGMVGLNASGGAVLLTLNGLGANSTQIGYKTGLPPRQTFHQTGVAYFGALQGTAGATDIWAGNISIGTPYTGISGGFSNASNGGILKITGVISGTGPVILGLNTNSTTVLAAANQYTGETQLTSGLGGASTVQLGANFGIPAASGLDFANNNGPLAASATFVYGIETFDLNGYNTSTAYVTSSTSVAAAFTTYSTSSATGSNSVITNTQNGSTSTLTILGAASLPYLGVFKDGSSTARLALDFNGGVNTVQTISGSNPYSGGTTIDSGTLIITTPASIGTGNITVNSTGGAILRSATAASAFSLLQSGYNSGNWNGSGINSTVAANDSTHLTAVGMLQPSSSTTFEGQTLNPTDVALKLTYYGDANLDGKVDGSDYSIIDNGSLQNLTGWYYGDFNYDGVIDGSDYTLIDNAFNAQGAQLSAQAAAPTAQVAGAPGNSAVPEPAMISLLSVGALGLLGRRRK